MRLFECQNCSQLLYFENTRCERCERVLGFIPEQTTLAALTAHGDDVWRPLAGPKDDYRFCGNAANASCNWLVPRTATTSLCCACELNQTIPNLDVPSHLQHWTLLEGAKRRLVYGLIRFGLPLKSKTNDPVSGLAFDFLADPDPSFREGPKILTGHREGLITINIAEADDAERERHRKEMAEPFRTILGHFRHEIGHYYWDRCLRDGARLAPFRALFGDERKDYGAALDAHYSNGPTPNWQERFVSAYASAHPWEDWAETWAHYMHIVDTLETAHAFGLRVRPRARAGPLLATTIEFDAYCQEDFDALIDAWLPVTYAVNSLNRSMGQQDLYPFVLAPTVLNKLRFVHDLILHGMNGKG